MRRCGHCGSFHTQALADSYQCLHCGGLTRYDGLPEAPEPVFNAKEGRGL
jgi:hypothetical protein